MKLINIQITLLLFLVISTPLLASEEEKDVRDIPIKERFFVGGNIGLQIGNLNTSVVISPNFGFRVTNKFSLGSGLTYQYYRYRGFGLTDNFSSSMHIYGGSLFARYRVTRQFFAHVEYEALNLDSRMDLLGTSATGQRMWEQNYFAGGGYRAPLGERIYANLMILYNFNSNSVIHFQNPIFRVGFDVRL